MLGACGEGTSSPRPGGRDSGGGTTAAPPGTGRTTTASPDAGPASADAADSTRAPNDEDSGADTSVGGTTGSDAPWDGEPLAPQTPGPWQWVQVEGSECIDGSPTGVGVRYGTGDGLVIYFEGGGSCFNVASCLAFYAGFANFNEAAFDVLVPTLLSSGVFADAPENPVRDWSFVYVPYCTGDVHAGNEPSGTVPGFAGPHRFVGYRNFGFDLERIGPTFSQPSHVLVTGISAGGYGAGYNYDRIATAYEYANIPVTLLEDSSPPMSNSYLSPCLQETWRTVWGLDATLPADCADCFNTNGWALAMTLNARARHPGQRFGLLWAWITA